MQRQWWVGAIISIVILMLGIVTGWALGWKPLPDSERAHSLTLRLLPLDEWGFSKEANAPVPISIPTGMVKASNLSTSVNHLTKQRCFRVRIPELENQYSSVFGNQKIPFYVRVGTGPKPLPKGTNRPLATLNNQFLQNQVQRQTQILQMLQTRLNQLQTYTRRAKTPLRPPQQRVIQIDSNMIKAQIVALQQAQIMTLQALAHTPASPQYMRITLAPKTIVSEKLLQRMATEGERVRLGPIEFARTVRVEIEVVN